MGPNRFELTKFSVKWCQISITSHTMEVRFFYCSACENEDADPDVVRFLLKCQGIKCEQ